MPLANILLFMLMLLIVTFLGFYLHHRKLNQNAKQRYLKGLLWLKIFRSLLASIQQYRGLTMGYLNGDASLLRHINTLKADINHQIDFINNNKGWIENNYIWNGISDHWQRLSVSYTKYEPDHNFRQHCNLIINLLNLIEDCADNHHLQELMLNKRENANFLWSQLLTTAENIGQIRAIGTSIAAAQLSSSSQRIKLNYLQSCVNVFLKNNSAFDSQLLTKLLKTINQEILSDKVDISAEQFFKLSTSALDVLLVKFDHCVNHLETNVDKR